MKKCSKCSLIKDESEFSKSSSTKDGLRYRCKKCEYELNSSPKYLEHKRLKWNKDGKAKRKEWIDKNPDRYKKQKEKYVNISRDYRRSLKKECVEYLGGKCVKCGFNKYLSSLDFHHLDPTQKEFSLSKAIQVWGNTLESLKKELDKCILLCKNCHTYEHIGY